MLHRASRIRCNIREEAQAVIIGGGVVGVNAFPAFVSRDPAPSVEHFLDLIDHMVGLIGEDHVGLGFDFSRETEEDYEYFKYKRRRLSQAALGVSDGN